MVVILARLSSSKSHFQLLLPYAASCGLALSANNVGCYFDNILLANIVGPYVRGADMRTLLAADNFDCYFDVIVSADSVPTCHGC